jgi:hypothetical protein
MAKIKKPSMAKIKKPSEASRKLLAKGFKLIGPGRRGWEIPEADAAVEREIFEDALPPDAGDLRPQDEAKTPRWRAISNPGGAPQGARKRNKALIALIQTEWPPYCLKRKPPSQTDFVDRFVDKYPEYKRERERVKALLKRYVVKNPD